MSTQDTTTFLIKKLRSAGLSQSEISRRTGIPQPRISRWGAGKATDVADDALKLAELVKQLDQPDSGAGGPSA